MKIICRDPDDIVTFAQNGTLERAAALGHEFVTTDSVLNAFCEPGHQVYGLAKKGVVTIKTFSEAEIMKICRIFEKHQYTLSFACCTIIYYTIVTQGVLISDQKILITACLGFGIKSSTCVAYNQQIQLSNTG